MASRSPDACPYGLVVLSVIAVWGVNQVVTRKSLQRVSDAIEDQDIIIHKTEFSRRVEKSYTRFHNEPIAPGIVGQRAIARRMDPAKYLTRRNNLCKRQSYPE